MKKNTILNTKEIIGLINHPFINRAELARKMFPHNKTPEQALQAELINILIKRITSGDGANAIQILTTDIINQIQNELL